VSPGIETGMLKEHKCHSFCVKMLQQQHYVKISFVSKTDEEYQYSETNVMHLLFNLLRIKVLYVFQALLAHPQEMLHNSIPGSSQLT
jgi:hypothetical protein